MNLGKMLFPNTPSLYRQKHIRTLRFALIVGMFISLIVAGLLYLLNVQGRI